jgi:hypothetical protein
LDLPLTTPEHACSLFGRPGRPEPVLLLGAGASVKSGIPLSGGIVERAARWGYCKASGLQYDNPLAGRRSDWFRWLHAQPWYKQDKHPEDNYSTVLRHVLNPAQERQDFFLTILNPAVPASPGVESLLDLMADGVVRTVLTTNFDHVIPDSKVSRKRPHHLQVIRTASDYKLISTSPTSPQLVYLHGSVEHHTDQNLLEEVQRLDSKLVDGLVPILRDHPLVVVGYRGAEPSVMHHLLKEQASATSKFRMGLFWCILETEIVHPLVTELAGAVSPNFQFVPIVGFDELMGSIAKHCAGRHQEAHIEGPHARPTDIDQLPFEMRPLEGASLDELDWPRVQKELAAYGERMGISVPATLPRDWLLDQLLVFDLVAKLDGKFIPTVAGYLLFAVTPGKRIKGAVTNVLLNGQLERKLNGNLWAQLENIITILEEINRPYILKSSTSELVYPYPKIALRELPANALVHRDYGQDGEMVIEIERGSIRFTNPGGLIDKVVEKARPSLQQQIELGVRGITGYRNPVLADLLCGTGKIEKKGSGLPDVHGAVTRNGGKRHFGPVDESNTAFAAVIFGRQEAVDELTQTAAPAANRSTYYTNLLEVVGLPPTAWAGVIDDALRRDEAEQPPPFARRSDHRILTFANLEDPTVPFAKLVVPETIERVEVETYLIPGADSRELVALMNNCLYGALTERGLVVDRDRKRAYFPRGSDGPHEIRYQASFRQATRTVTRPFVSRQTQRVLYWEHEAIWFGFERFMRTWALRILPGYVFTMDGREQLMDHLRVGALATRKAARDFNQQVLNDLVFWSWVLGSGLDSFDITTGGRPISVLAGLASCQMEVPAEADLPFNPQRTKLHFDIENLENEIAEETEAGMGEA